MHFLGTYEHSVDERGRVAIPARYRDAMGPSAIIARGPDRCLEVYTLAGYEEKAAVLANGSGQRLKDRRLDRAYFGGALEVDIDRQGRVLIPPLLRQWAGITGPVAIVGRGKCLEIWDAAAWAVEVVDVENDYTSALETMEPR